MNQLLVNRKIQLVKALREYDKKEATNAFFYSECEDLSLDSVRVDHFYRWETRGGDLYACIEEVLKSFEGLSIQNDYGKMTITVDYTKEEKVKIIEEETQSFEDEINAINEYFENESIEIDDEELNAYITTDKSNEGDFITFFGNLNCIEEICINAKTDYMLPKDGEVSLGLLIVGDDEEFSKSLIKLHKRFKFNTCLI